MFTFNSIDIFAFVNNNNRNVMLFETSQIYKFHFRYTSTQNSDPLGGFLI
jgi:hypothetical protein